MAEVLLINMLLCVHTKCCVPILIQEKILSVNNFFSETEPKVSKTETQRERITAFFLVHFAGIIKTEKNGFNIILF